MKVLGASIVLLLLVACSSSSGQVARKSSGPSASPAASPPATPSTSFQPIPTPAATGAPIPEATPTPTFAVGNVSCPGVRPLGDPLALVAAVGGKTLLFDVADPLRPHLVCTATNASVRFVSRDEIAYITAFAPGSIQVYRLIVGGTPTASITFNADGVLRDWRPDGTFAYTHNVPGPSAGCCGVDQLHLVSAGVDHLVCSRRVGIIGIGGARFYPFTLASFSPDGAYYAQTTFAGKGGETCDLIARAADGSVVAPLAGGVTDGVWSNVTDRLYYVTAGAIDSWDPAAGATRLNVDAWIAPRIGPGGTRVAYTYYVNKSFAEGDIRVGIFDLQAGTAIGGIPDKPRSEAAFVTPTLLWYLEEGPCAVPNGCFTGDTSPTGRILAFDTVTGAETPVSFAPGESPVNPDDYQAFNVQLPAA